MNSTRGLDGLAAGVEDPSAAEAFAASRVGSLPLQRASHTCETPRRRHSPATAMRRPEVKSGQGAVR
ncbi:MAG: hypothetical protein ACKO38_03030, partial [Planctomycetota bacterium]